MFYDLLFGFLARAVLWFIGVGFAIVFFRSIPILGCFLVLIYGVFYTLFNMVLFTQGIFFHPIQFMTYGMAAGFLSGRRIPLGIRPREMIGEWFALLRHKSRMKKATRDEVEDHLFDAEQEVREAQAEAWEAKERMRQIEQMFYKMQNQAHEDTRLTKAKALAILGLSSTATLAQVKKTYKKLALIYHQDKNLGDTAFDDSKLKELSEAYNFLKKEL